MITAGTPSMSFKQLLKGSRGDQKDRDSDRSLFGSMRAPSSVRVSSGRTTSVLYLGDARETRLMTGAFSHDHPHLAVDISGDLTEASARIADPGRYEALVVGWSVSESDAAAFVSQVRAKGYPIAIVAIAEHSLDRLREAGADQCLQKGHSLLARLPGAIEEAVKNQATSADTTTIDPFKHSADEPPPGQVASLTQELAALRQKEARLRALVDKLPTCVVRVAPDGQVLATNTLAQSLLGATQPNQLLRKSFDALVDEDARSTWNDFVTRVCDGEQQSCEVPITALDGVSRTIEAIGVSSPSEGGSGASGLIVLRDISDRKRLERALEEANRRAVPVVASSDAAPVAVPDVRVLRDLETDLNRLADRARATLSELGTLLHDAASQHDAIFTRQVEAYTRVKAEQLEHWRSYEAFVQTAASGVFRVSLDDRMQMANHAFAKMLGYDSPELLTEMHPPISHLTDDVRWRSAVERWRAGETDPAESPWRRKDGGLASLRLHGRVVSNASGEADYVEVVADDLGAQRGLETQLRRARRWEQAARVTSGIAADLTHVVESIKDASERLQVSSQDETARQHVDAIGQAVSRAAALSRQLVAFGRKEARDPRALDLNDAVRRFEGVLRRLIDEHIEIAIALAPSLGTIEASEPALEEAVVHLTVAATSALPAGGRIDIATALREVGSPQGDAPDSLRPGLYALLSITASGWGIDAEVQDRASGTVTGAAAKDVSQGLAVARRSVSRMSGEVSVAGVPGTSLTFNIFLPRVHGTDEFESEEFRQDVNTTSNEPSSEA
ncbi:MAG TPA: PAS domain S-box protein [Vicinamibacterales bacterium]